MSNCVGPINIIPDNNQVVLLDNNRSITIIDNNCCTTVTVTQPITNVVQVLTGPMGPMGQLPTSGSFNLTGSINVSGSISSDYFYGGSFSGSFTGSFSGSTTDTLQNVTDNGSTTTHIISSSGLDTNALNVLGNVNVTGSLTVSGSNTFRNIGPAQFTGSVDVLGRQSILGNNGYIFLTPTIGSPNATIQEIHGNDDYPWIARFYNDTFSNTLSVMSYFGWNDGRFVFHNDSTQSIGLQVNGYSAENGLLVYPDKVAFVNNVEVSGSINLKGGSLVYNLFYGGGIDIVAAPGEYVELASSNTQSLIWVDDFGAYIQTSASHNWNFYNDGTLSMPGGVTAPSFTGSLYGTSSWAVSASNFTEVDPIFTAASGTFATTGSNLFLGNQSIDGGSSDGFGSGLKYLNQGFAHYTTGVSGSTFVIADSSANYYSTWANADIKLQIGATDSSFNTNLAVTGSVIIQGGADFGVKIGKGESFSLSSDAYALMSSISGSPAGYTINRGDSTSYASIDLITAQDVSKGWSIQTTPGSDNLIVLDREGSTNIISITPNNGGISINSDLSITGSLNAPSITGSLLGTSSWAENSQTAISSSQAENATSASYALTASYASNVPLTASYAISSSQAISSSYASTASYVVSSSYSISSSYSTTASYYGGSVTSASYASSSTSASYASSSTSASYALTASYVTNAQTASYVLSASYAVSSSQASTASYYGGSVISSSYASSSTSASYALTASYSLNGGGNINTGSFVTTSSFNSYTGSSTSQFAGTSSYALTASYYGGSVTSASYASSSTSASYALTASYVANASSFPFTGSAIITGSLIVTGSISTNDGVYVQTVTASFISASGGITGSLFGTASFVTGSIFTNSNSATSASYAVTASYSTYAATAGNGGVTQLTAGSGISISPAGGTGNVTVTALGGSNYNTSTGSYGAFHDTGSYSISSTTTAYSTSLSTTDITNGVFVSGSDKTKIYFTNAGIYNVEFSMQFQNSDSQNQVVNVWLRQGNDGGAASDVAYTNGQIGIPNKTGGVSGAIISAWNYFIGVAANDYIQLMYQGENTNISLVTLPAGTTPTTPITPSTILTANRIDTFLSNTGSFSGSFTGTLTGTASYASQALSSSYASTASYVTLAQTASYVTLAQTASYVTTAQTASYITGSIHTSTNPALSASYASSSTSASYASSSTSASYALTASSISSNYITDFLPVTFDGQGAVININTNGTIYIPYNCTITGWTLLESSNPTPLTASVTLDAWKNIYASYPPTASNTIFGTKPTLTSAIKNQATGLSIAATAGDLMIVTVVSCSLAQRLKFGFAVSKT